MPSQDGLALRGGTQTSFAYGCCNSPKLLGVWAIGLHAPLLPTACCKCNCFTCPFSVSDFNYPQLLWCQDYWVISMMQEVRHIKSKVQSLSSIKKSFFQLFVWCWAGFFKQIQNKTLIQLVFTQSFAINDLQQHRFGLQFITDILSRKTNFWFSCLQESWDFSRF